MIRPVLVVGYGSLIVIHETLKRIPEGAYVAYIDSGFVFKKNIIPLFENLGEKDVMVVALDKDIYGLLGTHVQREALVLSGCDTLDCRRAPHIWAGLSFYRNSPKSRAFVVKWLELSQQPNILVPQKSKYIEYPEFVHHHNDQSTLSLTTYLMRTDVNLMAYEKVYKYFAWHHRMQIPQIYL